MLYEGDDIIQYFPYRYIFSLTISIHWPPHMHVKTDSAIITFLISFSINIVYLTSSMTSSHDPACWIYFGKIILMKVYILPTHSNIATIMHVADTVSMKVYVDHTFPIFTQIQTISTKIYWFKLIKAKKSPFPPKSMLKNVYIRPTSTETPSVGYMQTCPTICSILNIDLGGKGG